MLRLKVQLEIFIKLLSKIVLEKVWKVRYNWQQSSDNILKIMRVINNNHDCWVDMLYGISEY